MDPTALADPSLWEQFGPFAIVFVVMTILGGGIIAWLLKDRAKIIARNDELTDQLIEASSRAVGLVEGMKPLLEANTRVLDRVRNP